jgi:hypothetical protein
MDDHEFFRALINRIRSRPPEPDDVQAMQAYARKKGCFLEATATGFQVIEDVDLSDLDEHEEEEAGRNSIHPMSSLADAYEFLRQLPDDPERRPEH